MAYINAAQRRFTLRRTGSAVVLAFTLGVLARLTTPAGADQQLDGSHLLSNLLDGSFLAFFALLGVSFTVVGCLGWRGNGLVESLLIQFGVWFMHFSYRGLTMMPDPPGASAGASGPMVILGLVGGVTYALVFTVIFYFLGRALRKLA